MHIKNIKLPNDLTLSKIKNEFSTNGYIIINSCSKQYTIKVLSLLFNIKMDQIHYNEISIKENSNLPSDTNSDIPWHQENYEFKNRLNILALRCKKGCNQKEPTKLIKSSDIIDTINDTYKINLADFKIRFKRRRSNKFTEYFNLIDIVNNNKVLRFAMPDDRFRKVEILNSKDNIVDNNLLKLLMKSIEEQKTINFPNKENSLLIFDNLLFLHARDKLMKNSERIIERYFFNYE